MYHNAGVCPVELELVPMLSLMRCQNGTGDGSDRVGDWTGLSVMLLLN
jgi:hypothetical protein